MVLSSSTRQGEEAAEGMEIKLIVVKGLAAYAERTSDETGIAVERARR